MALYRAKIQGGARKKWYFLASKSQNFEKLNKINVKNNTILGYLVQNSLSGWGLHGLGLY